MRRVLALACVLGVLWRCAIAWSADAPLILRDVHVVDIKAATASAPQTVLVVDGRVQSIGPAVVEPSGARAVECQGGYLIPGLWDMHAHFSRWLNSETLHLPLCIAWGVTSVQDMGDLSMAEKPNGAEVELKRAWSNEAVLGQRVGPRFIAIPGFGLNRYPVEAPETPGFEFFAGRNPDDLRKLARYFKNDARVDFANLHDQEPMSRENYFAFMEEARRINLPVRGHKAPTITVAEALAAGQHSIEHSYALIWESSTVIDKARQEVNYRNFTGPKFSAVMVRTFDLDRMRANLELVKQHDAWLCPTHVTRKSEAMMALRDKAFLADPRRRFLSRDIDRSWQEQMANTAKNTVITPLRQARVDHWKLGYKVTKSAQEMGVKVVTGSDAMSPFCFHGSGIHDELAEFVAAGLTPSQALCAATLTPAQALNRVAELGTIDVGKLADLVLLDANPLDDIENTRKIRAVVFNGRLFDRAALDALLSGVERAAKTATTPQE